MSFNNKLVRIFVTVFFFGTLLTHCSTSPESREIAEEIIAWWPGDGSPEEIIENGQARLEGSGSYAPGVAGDAFFFNEIAGQVMTDLPAMQPTQELTIEAWVKHDFLGDKIQRYITAVGGCVGLPDTTAVLRYGPDRGLHFYMVFEDRFYHTEAPGVVIPGRFHHVAGVYDEEGLWLYCDGVLVDQLEIDEGPCCFDWVSFSSLDEPMRGSIDEVIFHSRSLEQEEIETTFRELAQNEESVPNAQGFVWRWLESYPAEPIENILNNRNSKSITIFPTVVHLVGLEEWKVNQGHYQQKHEWDTALKLWELLPDLSFEYVQVRGFEIPFPQPVNNQGEVINSGLQNLNGYLKEDPINTDYMMQVELIIMNLEWDDDGAGVWAVECYILNSDGEDVFSLVLNSQWDLFNEANLFVDVWPESTWFGLVDGAVRITIDALRSHLEKD